MNTVIDYGALLNQARGMETGINAGYQSALAGLQSNQSQTMAGYNQLQNTVLSGLTGQGQARSQEIADLYNQRAGSAMERLVSSGLGNSTIQASVGRGFALDQAKAQNQLSEQVAAQRAQYQTNLGLAGLGYQNTATMQQQALLGQQLGYQQSWQNALLGAAMPGLNMQEQYRLQRMNQVPPQLAGGGIVRSGGGGGGGGRSGYGGGGWNGSGGVGDPYAYNARAWAANQDQGQDYNMDEFLAGLFGGGGGGGGGYASAPGVSTSAASLVGLLGGSDPFGGLAYAGLSQGEPESGAAWLDDWGMGDLW